MTCERLFRFADGRVEWRAVDVCLPRVWLIGDLGACEGHLDVDDFSMPVGAVYVRERAFYRMKWRTPAGYIGPRIDDGAGVCYVEVGGALDMLARSRGAHLG